MNPLNFGRLSPYLLDFPSLGTERPICSVYFYLAGQLQQERKKLKQTGFVQPFFAVAFVSKTEDCPEFKLRTDFKMSGTAHNDSHKVLESKYLLGGENTEREAVL